MEQDPDVFVAIADPRRREILEYLASSERPVNDVVARMSMAQPQVSKHLQVLREAGLVEVRKDGRRRLYRTRARGLDAVRKWTARFDAFWTTQLGQIKASAERGTEPDAPDGKDT